MIVYIFYPKGEKADLKKNCCFSMDKKAICMNEEFYDEIEVTEDEYHFMVDWWDDCIERGEHPEVYIPRPNRS
jgi:hypothetical protein